MKHRIPLLMAAVFAAGVMFAPSSAEAVPTEPVTSIDSPGDGGLIPDAVTIAVQSNYVIQCKNPSCMRAYKFDGGTQTADCSNTGTGFQLPYVNQAGGVAPTNGVQDISYPFESGAMNRLRVAALDGGQPRCKLYLNAVNR